MAAQTQDRNTPFRFIGRKVENLQVLAATDIFAGSMVCVTAAGFAVPASDTAGLSAVIGRAAERADNSLGASGDIVVCVEVGVFKYANTDLVQASKFTLAEVTFDNEAQVSGANGIVAGRVEDIDDDGDVWLAVGLGY